MGNFFSEVFRNGKTITGATISVLATVVGALTPQDLAAVAPLIGGASHVGTALMVIGLLDKVRKALVASQPQ